MSNKNLEAFEQMRKLTKEAKKFYADNYNPGSLYPPRDTKFFLNEEYIPFDFETAYDDPLYKEYRRVRMLQDPFEDEKEEYNKQDREDKDTTTDESSYDNIKPAKGITDYFIDNLTDIAYGADRALSGATFGGYDWLKKKSGIGIDEDKYLKHKQQTDGSDMAARIGGTIAEIGGNIMGGGGALVKGLSQAGLSGAKLATASGAIGGGLYGISSSNSLSEIPYNAAVGSLSGGALGGLGYLGYQGANGFYNNALLPKYNLWQIGRGYDRLIKNPYQGKGSDIITTMKNHNGEKVWLQRGEAIMGENGQPIVSGGLLKSSTGSKRNYGLNKIIYKHGMTKEEAQMIPYNIRKQPVEISPRGQDIYETYMGQDKLRTIASPVGKYKTIASFYKDTR